MKVNFTKIELNDIEGNKIPDSCMYKDIANAIYLHSQDLDLVCIAMQINKGEEIEVTKKQLSSIREVIKNPRSGFFAYAKKAAFDFIDDLIASEDLESK